MKEKQYYTPLEIEIIKIQLEIGFVLTGGGLGDDFIEGDIGGFPLMSSELCE